MAKMDDDDLLGLLNGKEEESSSYVHGQLAGEREKAMREYHREPYGNEEEGWSTIVTSEVQDTVEWVLPTLLDIFTSTDQAVSFEPNREKDVQGAEQATDGCNHVFYKQNNGFLILYTAFKDALTVKNCAVMWRKHEQETPKTETYRGLTEEQLAYILSQSPDSEIVQASAQEVMQPDPMTGMPIPLTIIDAKVKTVEKRKTVKVEAFPPENLLVQRNWTSPLLQDCPYVCRMMEVTLSELHEMGYDDVTADDLGEGSSVNLSADASYRANRTGEGKPQEMQGEDDSQLTGWLRIEFVLCDRDGDGIAERLCVYRLKDKILKVEEVSHVQIATASPILISHRWDGLSLAEVVSDLQQLKTEITRQTLNSLYLANNPRTGVLTDANWSPMANLDDLLDSRPGGIVREKTANAARELITPFVGGQSFPMLEYVDQMASKRTGINDQQQGLNPNALQKDKTLGEAQIQNSAAQQRIKLIARIMAEVLVKPVFQGILKLLTDGGMDKLAMKLGDRFVELDPEEWRDQYDMTINVGLGTGDKKEQFGMLQMILQHQATGIQMGLSDPSKIYHTLKKLTESAGFKNVSDFWLDPKTTPPKQPGPPLEILLEQAKQQGAQSLKQMELQADAQKFQAETQRLNEVEQLKAAAKLQEVRANLELQAANDQRDAERELMTAERAAMLEQAKIETDRWKAQLASETQIYLEQLKQQVAAKTELEGNDTNNALAAAIDNMSAAVTKLGGPKRIVRDPKTNQVIGTE